MIHAEIDVSNPRFDPVEMSSRQGELLVHEWQMRYDPEFMARRRAEEWVVRATQPAYQVRAFDRNPRYQRRISQMIKHSTIPAMGVWPSDPAQHEGALLVVREDPLQEHFDGLMGLPLDRVTEKPLAAQLFEKLESLSDRVAKTDRKIANSSRRGEPFSLPEVQVGDRQMIVDFAPMPSGSQVFTMRYADHHEEPQGFHLVRKEDDSFLITAAEMHGLPLLRSSASLLQGASSYIEKYGNGLAAQADNERLRDVLLDFLFSRGRKAAAVVLLSQSLGFIAADNFVMTTDHEGSPLGSLPTNAEVIEIGERASYIGAYTSMDQSITQLSPTESSDVVLAREGEAVRLDLSGDDGVLDENECIDIRAEVPRKDGLRFASSNETSLSVEVERLRISICNTGSIALRGDQLKSLYAQRGRHDDLPFPLSHII